jgi:hypothetical protein
MNGFGGAGAFSDGKYNITTEFGGTLHEYIGKEEAIDLMNYVDKINLAYGGEGTRLYSTANTSLKTKCLQNGLHLLDASVRHLGTDVNYIVLENLYNKLSKNVDFYFRTPAANVEKTENGYRYDLIPELAESGISLENVASPETARELAQKVQEMSLVGITAAISEGTAVFENLIPGLFLVVQQEATPGFSPMAPFLISLPVPQGNGYAYDLVAAPKVALEPEATEPPPSTEPPPDNPPDIPQTGQLNWPVPVLTVWGVLTVAFGLVLCFQRKGNR